MNRNDNNLEDVYLEVISVNFCGWARARVIRNSSRNPIAKHGDFVSIHKQHGLKKGDHVWSKITRNAFQGKEPWFAVRCERESLVKWESWQDGKSSLAILLPSTAPGSVHDGICFGCWNCGKVVVKPREIFRIKNTAIWTTTIQSPNLVVDSETKFNNFKACYVQRARCSCGSTLGSYYENRYPGSPDTQAFPCFKLITAWERKKWFGDKPVMATVLLGNMEEVEDSIAKLKISEEWGLDQCFQGGGRVDQHTYDLMEKAKVAMRGKEEAEKRAVEAEEKMANLMEQTKIAMRAKEVEAEKQIDDLMENTKLAMRAKEEEAEKKIDHLMEQVKLAMRAKDEAEQQAEKKIRTEDF